MWDAVVATTDRAAVVRRFFSTRHEEAIARAWWHGQARPSDVTRAYNASVKRLGLVGAVGGAVCLFFAVSGGVKSLPFAFSAVASVAAAGSMERRRRTLQPGVALMQAAQRVERAEPPAHARLANLGANYTQVRAAEFLHAAHELSYADRDFRLAADRYLYPGFWNAVVLRVPSLPALPGSALLTRKRVDARAAPQRLLPGG